MTLWSKTDMVWEKPACARLFVCPCCCNYLCVFVTLRSAEAKKKKKRRGGEKVRESQRQRGKTGRRGVDGALSVSLRRCCCRAVARCVAPRREITGCRRCCLLTFAVHHAVVFVVFRSLPSHIQQPPGAGAQHHRDRALRLLDGDR